MKVFFCFPPPEDDIRLPKGGNNQEWYGVGIGYLQAYLEKHGHQTDSYQDYFTIWSEYCPILMKKIEEFKPDIIAVQLYSMNRFNAFRILEICKERKIKCVFGGVHASAFPNEIINHFPRERGYDLHVVCGEGEIALLDIVEGRETGQIVKRDLIQDLDSLIWYHPRFLKYALGDSIGYMFPRLYTVLRGYKLQPRWLNAQDERHT